MILIALINCPNISFLFSESSSGYPRHPPRSQLLYPPLQPRNKRHLHNTNLTLHRQSHPHRQTTSTGMVVFISSFFGVPPATEAISITSPPMTTTTPCNMTWMFPLQSQANLNPADHLDPTYLTESKAFNCKPPTLLIKSRVSKASYLYYPISLPLLHSAHSSLCGFRKRFNSSASSRRIPSPFKIQSAQFTFLTN